MAIGFGSTRGVTSADRILTASESIGPEFSFHCWTNRNGEGGGSLGRIFDKSNFLFFNNHPNSASTYALGLNSAADTRYQWTRPASGIWAPIGFSVNTTSSSNTPTVYQQLLKLTIGSGVSRAGPEMSWPTSSSAWCIGNRASDAVRGWDGDIAEIAWWNTILTDEEFYALQRGVSPERIRPGSIVHYLSLIGDGRLDKGNPRLTLTGTKPYQPHPPIKYKTTPKRILVAPSSGATSYTITPSGQLVLSGSTGIIKTKIFLPNGNISFSGSSKVIKTKLILPSGEVTLSGQATVSKGRVYSPSGGLSLSGSTIPIKSKIIAPTGSITFSGTASLSGAVSYQMTPVGKVNMMGSAKIIKSKVLLPTGRVNFSGSAPMTSNTVTQVISSRIPMTGAGQ